MCVGMQTDRRTGVGVVCVGMQTDGRTGVGAGGVCGHADRHTDWGGAGGVCGHADRQTDWGGGGSSSSRFYYFTRGVPTGCAFLLGTLGDVL